MDTEKTVPLSGNQDVQIAQESKAHVAVTGASSCPPLNYSIVLHLSLPPPPHLPIEASPMQQCTDNATDSSGPTPPVRTSSIQSVPVLDDSSSLTTTSKPPPSASTVGTEVPPTVLNTNTSSSQKRNSLLAVPVRTSSTNNTAEQSPTSTSSTAVTATGDVDAVSTTSSRKRRRRREGGSNSSSVTGEEGRSHKQGGIGRFFGFLCCRAGASPEDVMNPGSRKANKRPGSASSRKATPVGKITAKDINVSDSRDAVETAKIVEDSGENKLKSEDSSVLPVILKSSEKDDDHIKTAEGEGLAEGKIIVEDSPAAEETSETKGLSLLDTTPTVIVQAPTPTPIGGSDGDSSRPGSASMPEPESVIKKEEDVVMRDAPTDDVSGDDGRVGAPLTIELPLPLAEEAQLVGDSDSDDASDAGQGPRHEGELVQTPQQWLLPPIAPRFEGKKCLVLDLDETLVHSSFKVLSLVDLFV